MKFLISMLIMVLFASCGDTYTEKVVKKQPPKEGTEVQNGGYGVKLKSGKVVSLDLFLRNSHELPYLGLNDFEGLTEEEIEIVRSKLSEIVTQETIDIILSKLSELRKNIEDFNLYYFTSFLIENMNHYTWTYIQGSSCKDVGDDNAPFKNKVQLAYRQDLWIRFCKDFSRLDSTNKAALILHEMVYSTLKGGKSRTVELVGLMFNQAYRHKDRMKNEFHNIIHGLEKNQLINSYSLILSDEVEPVEKYIDGFAYCFVKGSQYWSKRMYGLYPKGEKECGHEKYLVNKNLQLMLVKREKLYIQSPLDIYVSNIRNENFSIPVASFIDEELDELCSSELNPNCYFDSEEGTFEVTQESNVILD